MDLHFLGGATTVTGSQHLLTTDRARVLVDCGMFQGGPDESIRNRVPFAYDPATIDALVLTHAHLDHCGLIPYLVREGFRGPIFATDGTVELASLVLLDSGRLQEEFADRDQRWEERHPDRAAEEDREDLERFEAAVELAEAGDELDGPIPVGESPLEAVPGERPGASVARATDGPAATPAVAAEPEPTTPERIAVDHEIEPPRPGPSGRDGQATSGEGEAPAVDFDEAIYTEADVRRALPQFRSVDYGAELEVAPGVHATFLDAGHILGSAIIRLRVLEGDRERTLVFSGDLGRPNTPIIRDPEVVEEADHLIVESTYGGREHDPQVEAVRTLAEIVRLVAKHDGVLLVPAFAIGRTQEIVWTLDRLIEAGAIPTLPLFLDSPMASRATDIYRRHASYFDEPTRKLLDSGATPLDYPRQVVTAKAAASRRIEDTKRPYMIVASNGMLTGGRVVSHLRRLVGDRGAVLLFVGYQGEGTLGRQLQDGAKTVRIEGQEYVVRCQVRSISGFSAHADEPELLAWVGHFIAGRKPGDPGVPRTVFLVHGDPDAQAALEPKVRALGFDTVVPQWHQRVTLD
jgi:metallo-beta-lactamase family protein